MIFSLQGHIESTLELETIADQGNDYHYFVDSGIHWNDDYFLIGITQACESRVDDFWNYG